MVSFRTAQNPAALTMTTELESSPVSAMARFTADERRAIASEIQRQLGGARFCMMTGARRFFHFERNGSVGLQFDLPRGFSPRRVNRVEIVLTPDDVYTVRFLNISRLKVAVIAEESEVYNDQLQTVFTRETGLDTHL